MKSDSSDSIEIKRTWVAQILEEGIKEKYNDKKIQFTFKSESDKFTLCVSFFSLWLLILLGSRSLEEVEINQF